jgi:tyrosyl-tRNA synthetase
LAGGATSLIGDPGGKDSERPMQTEEVVHKNVAAISNQIKHLLGPDVEFVNNLSWTKNLSVLDFLRDVGKHFSMTTLIQRDYIAKRLGKDGAGISYTEFSYTLLQGYDFLVLHQKYGVDLQLAGSDQWGNCLSGVDLVRRVTGDQVNAFTCPLIIDQSTGKKFGKSEAGAIWLDPAKTTPDQFYQFWLNADDQGVESYLKIFTELDKQQIDQVMGEFRSNPSGRAAQKLLAKEVTTLVHGADLTHLVSLGAAAQFSGKGIIDHSAIKQLQQSLSEVLVSSDSDLINALASSELVSSNSEALRFLKQGGVYLNNQQMTANRQLVAADFIDGFAVLRRGKNNSVLLKAK